MVIQSFDIKDPTYNPFTAEQYSGSKILSAYQPEEYVFEEATPGSTPNTILTSFGRTLLSMVIQQYNTNNGTQYDPNNFGMISMPNDQNSQCAFLIFPLDLTDDIVIRVYLQLGQNTKMAFRHIDFVPGPSYTVA